MARYSEEQKSQALQILAQYGRKAAVEKTGIPSTTLLRWRTAAEFAEIQSPEADSLPGDQTFNEEDPVTGEVQAVEKPAPRLPDGEEQLAEEPVVEDLSPVEKMIAEDDNQPDLFDMEDEQDNDDSALIIQALVTQNERLKRKNNQLRKALLALLN